MTEYITTVVYDDNPPDEPCVLCSRATRGGHSNTICVGYTGDNARELQRIVTEQGYLEEHDKQIMRKFKSELLDGIASKQIVNYLLLKHKDIYNQILDEMAMNR